MYIMNTSGTSIEEINDFYDINNNFPVLLKRYLRSPELSLKFEQSKSGDQKKFIRNQRFQLNKLYEEKQMEKPRMKEFQEWILNNREIKIKHVKQRDNNENKDQIIEDLRQQIKKLQIDNDRLRKELSFSPKSIPNNPYDYPLLSEVDSDDDITE